MYAFPFVPRAPVTSFHQSLGLEPRSAGTSTHGLHSLADLFVDLSFVGRGRGKIHRVSNVPTIDDDDDKEEREKDGGSRMEG